MPLGPERPRGHVPSKEVDAEATGLGGAASGGLRFGWLPAIITHERGRV